MVTNFVKLSDIAKQYTVSLGTVSTVVDMLGLTSSILGGGGKGKVRYLPVKKIKKLTDYLEKRNQIKNKRQKVKEVPQNIAIGFKNEPVKKDSSSKWFSLQEATECLINEHKLKVTYWDVARLYKKYSKELQQKNVAKKLSHRVFLSEAGIAFLSTPLANIRRAPRKSKTDDSVPTNVSTVSSHVPPQRNEASMPVIKNMIQEMTNSLISLSKSLAEITARLK